MASREKTISDTERLKNLKKAAEEYASMSSIAYKGVHCTYVDDQIAFIAGAEWKDKQFEDIKDEIKVDIRRELAWEIREKIHNGASLIELDIFVRNICKL